MLIVIVTFYVNFACRCSRGDVCWTSSPVTSADLSTAGLSEGELGTLYTAKVRPL